MHKLLNEHEALYSRGMRESNGVRVKVLYSRYAVGSAAFCHHCIELSDVSRGASSIESVCDGVPDVLEGEELINQLEGTPGGDNRTMLLAHISDWFGDMIVYCASELAKYGMRTDDVLGVIMASNMSKLGEDGKPLYDARGKVLKGPGYWKPEPMIQRLIEARIRSGE